MYLLSDACETQHSRAIRGLMLTFCVSLMFLLVKSVNDGVPTGTFVEALLWMASHGHHWINKAGSDAVTKGSLTPSPREASRSDAQLRPASMLALGSAGRRGLSGWPPRAPTPGPAPSLAAEMRTCFSLQEAV